MVYYLTLPNFGFSSAEDPVSVMDALSNANKARGVKNGFLRRLVFFGLLVFLVNITLSNTSATSKELTRVHRTLRCKGRERLKKRNIEIVYSN